MQMFKTGDRVKFVIGPKKIQKEGTVIALFNDEETGEQRIKIRCDERIIPGNKNRQLGKITPDLYTSDCYAPTLSRFVNEMLVK